MRLSAKSKFIIIVGDPVSHSLSPAIHNAAYEKLAIDDQFVYLGANLKVANLKEVILAMRVMDNFYGLTCTIPHKVEVLKYLDWVDEKAKKIGAVNTVVKKNGLLCGYNTDWLGAVIPLEKITSLKGKKVLVVGAGGAARAIVYGLKEKEAVVYILNRTLEKAKNLAKEFKAKVLTFNQQKEVSNFDIIINATSVGMEPLVNETPINPSFLKKNQIVFDVVYNPKETKLLKEAKKKGAKIIYGFEMLLYQGVAQFEIYTGKKPPIDVMRKVLMEKLKV
jgi:shikimate dehydrogenase